MIRDPVNADERPDRPAAGNGHLFVRLTAGRGTHSRLAEPDYLAPLLALADWIETGERPTPGTIRQRCEAVAIAQQVGCSLS